MRKDVVAFAPAVAGWSAVYLIDSEPLGWSSQPLVGWLTVRYEDSYLGVEPAVYDADSGVYCADEDTNFIGVFGPGEIVTPAFVASWRLKLKKPGPAGGPADV